MPRRDGTGPAGQGSMTGRGMGFCAGFNSPGFSNGGFGRGMGRGFAWRARAFKNMPFQVEMDNSEKISQRSEKQFLEQELDALKDEMQEVEKRLKEIS